MAQKLRNKILKNGEKMKMQAKNGMKNGERFTEMTSVRNGAINGKLISKQAVKRVKIGDKRTRTNT